MAKRAEAVSKHSFEVLIAPEYTPEALAIFARQENVRVLHIDLSQIKKPALRGNKGATRKTSNALVPACLRSNRLITTSSNAKTSKSSPKSPRPNSKSTTCYSAGKWRSTSNQRDCLLWQRHDPRRRRRANEPSGLAQNRLDQSRSRGLSPQRFSRCVRCLLPIPRRFGCGD